MIEANNDIQTIFKLSDLNEDEIQFIKDLIEGRQESDVVYTTFTKIVHYHNLLYRGDKSTPQTISIFFMRYILIYH